MLGMVDSDDSNFANVIIDCADTLVNDSPLLLVGAAPGGYCLLSSEALTHEIPHGGGGEVSARRFDAKGAVPGGGAFSSPA